MNDTLSRLQRHMELSQTLGAPVEGIPAKSVAVIELVAPYLTKHTTPREAGIVMGSVYAYFAALLTRDTGGDVDMARQQLHDLLDVAINIVGDIGDMSEED
jgi:hypothetical protein